jgi:hypothetical protein
MRDSIASLSLIGVRDTETKRFVEWLDPANAARVSTRARSHVLSFAGR